MRVNRLKILSSFRGLPAGYEVTFDNLSDEDRIEPLCFVGLNGSGKSNVLEAISECFYYLEAFSEERSPTQLKRYRTDFGFDIEFELDPSFQDVPLSWVNLRGFTWSGVGKIKIRYVKNVGEFPYMSLPESTEPIEVRDRENFILPNRIVGYSSGMNELISNPFMKIDFFYLEKLREQAKGIDTYRPQLNRMFLMDYEANKIITVCTQIYKRENRIAILNEEINVADIDSFSIYIRDHRPNFVNFKFPSSINNIIEKLKRCAATLDYTRRKYRLGFKIDDNSREAFYDNWNSGYELFRDLYQLRLMNLFLIPDFQIRKARDIEHGKNLASWLPKTSSINQIFFMDDICFKGSNNERINYKHLSDGEHQLLHALSGMMLLESRNSIFILDEPDTHFNPEWRSKFVSLLNDILVNKDGNQQIFITSHSPFIVSDCKPENVFLFKKANAPVKPSINTFGSSVNLITMHVFGKTETIAELSDDRLKKIREDYNAQLATKEQAIQQTQELGESVEKTILVNYLLKQPN